jgi:hypothetical protein
MPELYSGKYFLLFYLPNRRSTTSASFPSSSAVESSSPSAQPVLPTPLCGLTQEQLLKGMKVLLGDGGVCRALKPAGSTEQCGEALGDHPTTTPTPLFPCCPCGLTIAKLLATTDLCLLDGGVCKARKRRPGFGECGHRISAHPDVERVSSTTRAGNARVPITDCVTIFVCLQGESLEAYEFKAEDHPRRSDDYWVDDYGVSLGRALLRRKQYIQEQCDRITAEQRQSHHYWRAPKGSGKSIFLKLMAMELQQRGCAVYSFRNAKVLDCVTEESIAITIRANLKRRVRTVIVVDEAQQASRVLSYLLREDPCGEAIILAAGLPLSDNTSPNFNGNNRYGASQVFLQASELNEFCDIWSAIAIEIKSPWSAADVREFSEWLYQFTGGQLFPILKVCDYVFRSDFVRENFGETIDELKRHMMSWQFIRSEACKQIRGRCFDESSLRECKEVLSRGKAIAFAGQNNKTLVDAGLWDHGTSWFTSEFFVILAYNFRGLNIEPPGEDVVEHGQFPEVAEAIIIGGLANMTESDFREESTHSVKMENAIGFCWGYHVREMFKRLFIAPQTRAETGEPGRTSLTVDFTFDGGLKFAVELSKNSYDIPKKIKKFMDKDGVYHQWKDRCVILNFQMVTRARKYLTKDPMVYSFVYDENTLYRGVTPLCSGVCRNLPCKSIPDARFRRLKLETDEALINRIHAKISGRKNKFPSGAVCADVDSPLKRHQPESVGK